MEAMARWKPVRERFTHGISLSESGAGERRIALVPLHPFGKVEDSLAMASDEDATFEFHDRLFPTILWECKRKAGLAVPAVLVHDRS